MANTFLKTVTKRDTMTENGAVSNSTSGSALVDQFGKAGAYRGRDINLVFADQAEIWAENAELALRFPFYLRLITRKTKVKDGFVTEKVQNGQGARDEAFKRLLWIAANHKELFYQNLWLLPIIGSWKDLWVLMRYDVELGLNCLDNERIYNVIAQGIECAEHINLIKKFMPRIKSYSKTKTESSILLNDLAKGFAKHMNWNCATYNKFKSSGTAHDFQKTICGGLYDNINWNHIPGRALNLLVNSKFIENHNLVESYTKWLENQPIAKYTGYPYELGHEFLQYRYGRNLPLYKRITLDKQFQSLIEKAKADDTIKENVWCALDTSDSMTCRVPGLNEISAYDICISLGIFFSSLNEGAFNKNVIMFDNVSHVKQLNGSFTEMMTQITTSNTAWGGTNFQSVIREICRVRRENPNIPLEEYPTTLLVVSDMQFDPIGGNTETNEEAMKTQLREVFPEDFVNSMKFIWWDVIGRRCDSPTTIESKGSYLFSGFDGSIINLLLGVNAQTEVDGTKKEAPSMEEMVSMALSQEILLQIKYS